MATSPSTVSAVGALTGDLTTAPSAADRYNIQEVDTLTSMLRHTPLHQQSTMRSIIRDRIQMLEHELAYIGPATRTTFLQMMGAQFRLRLDVQRGKLASEQWIPALRHWLVNGYYDLTWSARQIAEDLKAHDPRKPGNDPLTQLAERRAAAAKVRAKNEAEGDARVTAAIDALPQSSVRQFVEVETALRTGEQITLRGDDRNRVEALIEGTRRAAALGDPTAQATITAGRTLDTPGLRRILPRRRQP